MKESLANLFEIKLNTEQINFIEENLQDRPTLAHLVSIYLTWQNFKAYVAISKQNNNNFVIPTEFKWGGLKYNGPRCSKILATVIHEYFNDKNNISILLEEQWHTKNDEIKYPDPLKVGILKYYQDTVYCYFDKKVHKIKNKFHSCRNILYFTRQRGIAGAGKFGIISKTILSSSQDIELANLKKVAITADLIIIGICDAESYLLLERPD